MTEMMCLLAKPTMDIECVCFDLKTCDIRINDGGHLVCRHGSNEDVIDGVAKVVCPPGNRKRTKEMGSIPEQRNKRELSCQKTW